MSRALTTGARGVTALAFACAAVLVWVQREAYRGMEAAVAGWTSALATGSHDVAYPDRATYFVNVGTSEVFGVVVTPECSSAIVTVVVLGAALLAVGLRRLSVARVVAAAAAAVGLFALVNILRLTFITFSADRWGLDDGYRFSHVWGGTAFTTLGGVLTVVAFLFVLSGRGSTGSLRAATGSTTRSRR